LQISCKRFQEQERERPRTIVCSDASARKGVIFEGGDKAEKKGTGPRKLLFVDARKAHLNPKCDGDVYIRLPEEAGAEPGNCGKLNFWLYGCRPAASAWENHYSSLLGKAGFRRGLASPVVFYHPGRDMSCVVHGDVMVG
jgi:hypothetical protein